MAANRKKCLLPLLFFFLSGLSGYGQQDPLFTQYMFNGLAINPAYAGSKEQLSLTLLARKQWMNMEGAPSTQTFSAHSPMKNERVALGLTFINDKIGVSHQYGINGVYAYRIPFKKGKISLGLQAGVKRYKSAFTSLLIQHPDPAFASDEVSSYMLNFGTGLYYSTDLFYLGLSVPHLLNNRLANSPISTYGSQFRHYFLTSGYVFNLSPDIKLKPSILLKMVEGAPVQLDFNTNVLINDVLWVGASYRSFSSFNFITQLQLTDQLSLGYAYDISLGKLRRFSEGGHELVISYNFSFFGTKVLTPRYF